MINPKTITYLTGAIIIVALAIGVFVYLRNQQPTDSVGEFNRTLEQAVVETPAVSPSANPIKQVLPTENPIEKTNPFKNEYQNPFE